ncbi:MAG: hypothetical protein ACTS6G_03830 [Candidatus Hodgkinia cicadicola]
MKVTKTSTRGAIVRSLRMLKATKRMALTFESDEMLKINASRGTLTYDVFIG